MSLGDEELAKAAALKIELATNPTLAMRVDRMLKPYQEAAIRALWAVHMRGGDLYISIPRGIGKTVARRASDSWDRSTAAIEAHKATLTSPWSSM